VVDDVTGTAYIPAAADVRYGTHVDATTGTCHVPAATNVRSGISVDATTGTLTFSAVTTTPVPQIGARLQLIRDAAYKAAHGTALQWADDGSWPPDIASVLLTVRMSAGDPNPALLAATGTILSGSPRIAQVEIAETVTAALGVSLKSYDRVFDLVAVLTNGDHFPLISSGTVTVIQNVSGAR
jgi:hypothetical protein